MILVEVEVLGVGEVSGSTMTVQGQCKELAWEVLLGSGAGWVRSGFLALEPLGDVGFQGFPWSSGGRPGSRTPPGLPPTCLSRSEPRDSQGPVTLGGNIKEGVRRGVQRVQGVGDTEGCDHD